MKFKVGDEVECVSREYAVNAWCNPRNENFYKIGDIVMVGVVFEDHTLGIVGAHRVDDMRNFELPCLVKQLQRLIDKTKMENER